MYDSTVPIFTKNLSKIFYPEKTVLEEIDLTIVDGETVGILGNNGSGKTTLLRILATLIHPSTGHIEIFGRDPRHKATEIKPLIGYLPERFSFYPNFTVNDIIDFFGRCNPITKRNQEDLREKIIKLLKMESYLQVSIHALSKGMLHKVGIAITLLHDPPLLLLDEPTSGLDPLIRTQVRKILRNLTNDFDKTVVISSHILEDIESVCDRVFFLESGKMLHDPFWISELTQKVSKLKRLEIQTKIPSNILYELSKHEKILYSEFNQINVDIYCQKDHVPKICNHLEDVLNITIKYKSHPITLEDIYILNHANINWLEYVT